MVHADDRRGVGGHCNPSTSGTPCLQIHYVCAGLKMSAGALDSPAGTTSLKSISEMSTISPRYRRSAENMVDPLKGFLSFNHFLMGPVGLQFLADLGADVLICAGT